jgi:hypothetical protein
MPTRLNYAEKGAMHVPGKKRGHVLYRKKRRNRKEKNPFRGDRNPVQLYKTTILKSEDKNLK